MDVASTPGSFTRLTKPGSTASSMELISTQILSGSVASIVFSLSSSQQTTYKYLQLRIAARTTTAAISEDIWVRFNSDATTANYTYHGLYGTGTAAGGENSFSWAGARIAQASGASDTANVFLPSIVDILDPFSTTKNKSLKALNGSASSQLRVFMASNLWLSTAAVSSITLLGGSGGSFVLGSRFSLYGVRA